MGYLTTFTIYNDGLHLIDPKNPKNSNNIKELVDNIYYGAVGSEVSGSVGNFVNMINVQNPKHSSDFVLFVSSGNNFLELNAYSKETSRLFKNNKEYAKGILKLLDDEIKTLKKLMKRIEGGEVDE